MTQRCMRKWQENAYELMIYAIFKYRRFFLKGLFKEKRVIDSEKEDC